MVTFTVQQKIISFTVQQPRPVSFVVQNKPISFTVANRNVTINVINTLYEEELIGLIDGQNKIFTTTKNFKAGSSKIFINGLKQRYEIDYTESGTNEITFSEAPNSIGFTDFLLINYII